MLSIDLFLHVELLRYGMAHIFFTISNNGDQASMITTGTDGLTCSRWGEPPQKEPESNPQPPVFRLGISTYYTRVV